jgi:hypothetical protein
VGVFVPKSPYHTSNGWQDDSVQFTEEENKLRIGTEACTLVTVLESKESEKGSNDLESSLLETEMEAGMEAEAAAFSFVGTVFSVKRTGDSSFLWEGGITFLDGMTGTDKLCDKGLGQDDEGRGENTALRMKYGWMV